MGEAFFFLSYASERALVSTGGLAAVGGRRGLSSSRALLDVSAALYHSRSPIDSKLDATLTRAPVFTDRDQSVFLLRTVMACAACAGS